MRIERRQVIEEDLVAGFLGWLESDRIHLDEGEIALAFLRRADLAGDSIARAEIEAADLRRGNINVIGTGQVVVFRGAEKTEAVRQAFQHAFGKNKSALFGLGLKDLEDQFLLAESRSVLDAHLLGDRVQIDNALVFEFDQIERDAAGFALLLLAAKLSRVLVLIVLLLLRRSGTLGRLGLLRLLSLRGLHLRRRSSLYRNRRCFRCSSFPG